MQTPSAALTGLSTPEARERLRQDGYNRLKQPSRRGAAQMLLDQLLNPFVLLLSAAAILAFLLGERVDAIAISAIVFVNALVGTVQEWRADQAIRALAAMTAPRARVLRDGRAEVLQADEIVRGDVLLLEAGDIVSADARIVELSHLAMVEASLTGESQPVRKSLEAAVEGAPLAERTDRVFAGTSVAAGTGRAVVVETGMSTELGRIAALLTEPKTTSTPLQVQLAAVSRSLLALCLAIVALISLLGLLRSLPWLDVLLAAVALAVAAVPEGLPAVVTIALAVGVQRMASRHVLVRRLPAVETLGCVTVICTDKTGTLTTGQMRVRELWAPSGDLPLLEAAAACCDAEIRQDGSAVGDPTEVALLIAARERGIERQSIEERAPRRGGIPFDSERKRMSIVRASESGDRIFVKGALGSLRPLCVSGPPPEAAREMEHQMAERGLRVMAIAQGEGGREEGLTMLGLVGIADPPRPSAVAAIEAARAAGIRTVMITGDHPKTALAVARELKVVSAQEPHEHLVYARVTPEDKLRIVRELAKEGQIVAMTGDGVNDAPAIREAHVGIAMGITGTEVTREAASVVLADDHFASIVEGVREGRTIHENIRKTVLYLVAGNTAELLLMLSASLLGDGAPPLLPIHLLWINLVTDGMPALALVVDPPDRDAMSVPPRDPSEPLLGRREWSIIAVAAVIEAAAVLSVYLYTLRTQPENARTMAFSALVFSELLRSFAFRSRGRVMPEVGVLSNVPLIVILLLSALCQIALTEIPAARGAFHLEELAPADWALALGAALVPVSALEIGKLLLRAWRAR